MYKKKYENDFQFYYDLNEFKQKNKNKFKKKQQLISFEFKVLVFISDTF